MPQKTGRSNHDLPPIEMRRHESSASGTEYGYCVEVRSFYVEPTVIGDFVIDAAWRRLPIGRGPTPFGTNIPVRQWDAQKLERGLLSRVVAEAHKWAFLAYLDADIGLSSLCVEVRLVKLAHEYSFKTSEVGVSEGFTAHEWLSEATEAYQPRVLHFEEK